jgi:hypothetical protein
MDWRSSYCAGVGTMAFWKGHLGCMLSGNEEEDERKRTPVVVMLTDA